MELAFNFMYVYFHKSPHLEILTATTKGRSVVAFPVISSKSYKSHIHNVIIQS